RKRTGEHGGGDCKGLGYIIGYRESRERPTGHQQLLADFHDFDELGWVRIQIHHVSRFFSRLRARVHGDSSICLGHGRSIVRSVSGHCHQLAVTLLSTNQVHLVLRRGLSKKVIHARFACDCSRSEWIIASDHDRLDSHGTELIEALAHSTLYDVFEFYNSKRSPGLFPDNQRRAPRTSDLLDRCPDLRWDLSAVLF